MLMPLTLIYWTGILFETGSQPAFSFTVETSQLFAHANGVIQSMQPVMYLVAGISLGFMIVGRIMRVMRSG